MTLNTIEEEPSKMQNHSYKKLSQTEVKGGDADIVEIPEVTSQQSSEDLVIEPQQPHTPSALSHNHIKMFTTNTNEDGSQVEDDQVRFSS